MLKGIKKVYEKDYKKLMIIPFLILFLALVQIGYQYSSTGDFVIKDITIKGGAKATIFTDEQYNLNEIVTTLENQFPGVQVETRELPSQYIINSDLQSQEDISLYTEKIKEFFQVSDDQITIEVTGSSLGNSFFKDIIRALVIAFIFMGLVVFIYFRTPVPSLAIMLAAFSDMAVTLAIINILGIGISTAGIVAFLLLIGYSVDTDILLTVRTLKEKEKPIMERVYGALKTGFTMNMTTLGAVLAAMLISKSEIITQIMLILFIGLIIDMLNTWIQNVGILRIYLERKDKK